MTPLKRNPPDSRPTCITYPEAGAMGRTGDWRIFRPIVDNEKCTGCQTCWMYCPDAAITMDKNITANTIRIAIFTTGDALRIIITLLLSMAPDYCAGQEVTARQG